MKRKIYAELIVDENQVIRNAEINGIPNDGTLYYVEREFGWLEQSGIMLRNAFISDADGTELWDRYIDYVVSWAFEHTSDEDAVPRIMTFKAWLYENGFENEYSPYKKKIPLIYPDSGAVSLVNSLGSGKPTANGDATSGYVCIATVQGRNKFVRACLIEESKDLPPEFRGYSVHVINDIDETDARTFRTESLDIGELANLLKDILEALQEGRM